MKPSKDDSFAERRKAAAEAKLHLLKKFQSAPKPDDPEMVAKRGEREAIAAARAERQAERARLKQLEQERLQAEAEARAREAEAQARAEAEAREAEKKNLVARLLADEAARKAERDRRYAARKARKN